MRANAEGEHDMNNYLQRTERINIGLSILVLVGAFLIFSLSWSWYSALFGVASSLVNLRVIGILAKRLTKGGVAAPVGIFTGKFALLLIICYVLVVVVKVDVLAFIAGLSTAYLSLVLSAMWGIDPEEGAVQQ